MKRIAIITLALLPCLAGAFDFALLARYGAQKVSPILALEPMAWWRGDGNALDSSGNGRHGTWRGTAVYTNGISGQAFYFSSAGGDRVSAPIPETMILRPSTVSFWVRHSELAFTEIFHLIDGTSDLVGAGAPSTANSMISRARIGGPAQTSSTGGSIAAETWAHVAVVLGASDTQATVYINGVAQTTSLGAMPLAASAETSIARWGIIRSGFTGAIDEPSVFDRAFTQSEIDILANPESYK